MIRLSDVLQAAATLGATGKYTADSAVETAYQMAVAVERSEYKLRLIRLGIEIVE